MGKNSFKLFTDYAEIFDNLSDEQAGQLIKAIFAHETGQEYSLDGLLNAVFVFIRQQLDRNRESYNTICEKNRQNIQSAGIIIRPYRLVYDRMIPHPRMIRKIPIRIRIRIQIQIQIRYG